MFTKLGLFKEFMRKTLLFVYAEEAPATPTPAAQEPTPPTPDPVNLEVLLARVRKEEKDKLYPQLSKTQNDLAAMTSANNANLLKVAALEGEVETLKNSTVKPDDFKVISEENKTLKEEVEKLKKKPDEAALRAQIEAEYQVKFHLEKVKSENKETVLSVFFDDIGGNTVEEIDASVEKAKTRTLETKKQLGIVDDKGNPIVGKGGKKKEDMPPPNNGGKATATVDLEAYRNMDVHSKEFLEARKQLGFTK